MNIQNSKMLLSILKLISQNGKILRNFEEKKKGFQ